LAAAVMGASASQIAHWSAHASAGWEMRRVAPHRSLPPCGGGTGRGVAANSESGTTPLPTPPPQGGREQAEFASRAPRNLPASSVFGIFQHDSHGRKLITNTISLLEVLRLARGVAAVYQGSDLCWVQAGFTRRDLLKRSLRSIARTIVSGNVIDRTIKAKKQ